MSQEESLDHSVIDKQQQRSQRFTDKIALWDLSGEQKSGIAKQVIDDMSIHLEYRSQMMLSIIIATLGLLIDATPVVIGAMIIAPILRPIQATSFATTTGNKHLFFNSLRILLISILGGICVAFLLTWLLPLTEITREIAIRTQPTLIDLGIAFASGLVAFLAMGWRKMSAGLAGVAMAASLVPPLAVIGIGIGFGNLDIARGSSILFLTNLIAIIVAGIIIFYLFGFHPTQTDDLKRSIRNSSYVLGMLGILCIPLATSFITINRNVLLTKTIQASTQDFFVALDPAIGIEELTREKENGMHNISLTLTVPQQKIDTINEDIQQELTTRLAQDISNDVRLQLTLIPVTSVSKKELIIPTLEQRLYTSTENFLRIIYHDEIVLLDLQQHTNKQHILIPLFYTDKEINTAQFATAYEEHIMNEFASIDIVIINRQQQPNKNTLPTLQQEMTQDISKHFRSMFSESVLHKLHVTQTEKELSILIEASSPLSNEQFKVQLSYREQQLNQIYDKKITTHAYIGQLIKVE